jgi:hypothetical protein
VAPVGVYNCADSQRKALLMKIATPVLTAAGVALVLAGCGSGKNDSTPAASASSSASSFAAELDKHAECIRSHGVPDFPDPQVKTSGHKTAVRAIVSASVVDSPHFKAAQEACKGLEPAPPGQGQSPQQQRERGQAMLAFAQCLRAHGVPGFPDPNAEGQLSFEMIKKAGVDLQAPAVLPAARACVGVTHGQITFPQVQEAIRHSTEPQSGDGGEGGGSESGQAGGQ